MSNIYVTEPPTSGKILLSTSKGDIEVELWAREAPKAVRNIVALAMEGYYDNMIWHRIVPGFCIQTGDPTGTGTGGESFYGEPFEDEPHQRLRFTRRGLLAMANPGEHNMNESQFFITLDATPELTAKHTIFGRISGPTIYNVLSLAEVELSPTEPDRPLYPPKLHTIKVLENPFDDIVPRITREEKMAQEANRRKARAEAGKRREKVKKNTGLLSFGEAEEAEDDGRFKGPKSSHDLLKNDKRLRKEAASPVAASPIPTPPAPPANGGSSSKQRTEARPDEAKQKKSKQTTETSIDLSRIRADHEESKASKDAQAQIQELEDSIRGLSKRKSEGQDEAERRKKINKGKQLLEEARMKYANSKASAKGKGKESETMDLLKKFQADRKRDEKAKQAEDAKKKRAAAPLEDDEEEYEAGMREYGASDEEGDDDKDWRSHRFDFGGKQVNEDKYTTDTYVTLDPRDTSSSAAASLGFGSGDAQKKAREEALKTSGRKGRDFVDERKWDQRRDGRQDRDRGGRGDYRSSGRQEEREEARPRDIERW